MASQEEINQVNEFKAILQARITEFQNKLFGTGAVTTISQLEEAAAEFNNEIAEVAEEIIDESNDSVSYGEVTETDLQRDQRLLSEELGF